MSREQYFAEAEKARWSLNTPLFLARLTFAVLAPLTDPIGQMRENWRRAK